jgi:tRNA-dihydrouridine synthase
MIGRGAMGRPRLFRSLRGHDEPKFDPSWLCGLLLDYAARLLAAGAPERAALGRVKQWLRLGSPADRSIRVVFDGLKRNNSLPEVMGALERIASGGAHLCPEEASRKKSAVLGL